MAAKGHRVGYQRVSTLDQNVERQLEGVELDRVFTDKASGKDTKRPQLQAALDYLREGDELFVHSRTGSPGTRRTCCGSFGSLPIER